VTAASNLWAPRNLGILGVLILAVLLGTLAGVDPKLGIAAALAVAFVMVTFANLAVGVTIFTILAYLELAPLAGGPLVSFSKLAGLTLALSWIAVVASESGHRHLVFSFNPKLMAATVLFLTWMAVSVLWAEDAGHTWSAVSRYALNLALIPIIFTAIRHPRNLRWVAGAFVGGAALAAIYGVIVSPNDSSAAVSNTAAGELDRATGTVGDPNLLASVLVVGMVMAGAVAADRVRNPITRMLSGTTILLCAAALIATASRGGLVALAAALLAAIFVAGPRYRARIMVLATIAVVGVVGYFAVFASAAQVDRVTTSDGGAGRTDIWKVGWRMFEANPAIGVGSGNFQVSSIHYLLVEPGAIERDEFIVDQPSVAHNLYLEMASEIGIVGLAMFVAIVVICTASAVRAARRFEADGDAGLSWIARAVVIALVATLAADFFLSAQFSKQLWILLSLGPAMDAISHGRRSAGEPPQGLSGAGAFGS
jgi:O-antigen ligase